MIRSMTGYGRKEVMVSGIHVTIEVRSVNNRFLDVQVKAPRSFGLLEPRIRKTVQENFSRGRFDVYINRNGDREAAGKLAVDEELLAQYIALLRDVQSRFGLTGEVDVELVAGFPGLISITEPNEDPEAVWSAVSGGLRQALAELDAMRAVEGKSLLEDIRRRIVTVQTAMSEIGKLSPQSVEEARKRMTEAIGRIMNGQPDPARMAQELAILAERTDVTEELTRLGSHIGQFLAMTSESTDEPVGRRLDFLLQEMGREANTIASKAMHAGIAHHVVDIKAELEKIREQVQNLE